MAETDEVQESIDYLATGGLGEVIGFTQMAMSMGEPQVTSDTSMAMALCVLAGEALDTRARIKTAN